MWRNINRTVSILVSYVNSYRVVSSTEKYIKLTKKHGLKTFLLLNCTVPVENKTENKEEKQVVNKVGTGKTDDVDLKFLSDVQKACFKNDEALRELMEVLSSCINEISKEYQENIEKQIDIITKCTKLGPVGQHWDELTEYRVHATELREELSKYEVLVQKVGQMAYNQAVTSLLSGINNAMDLLEVDFTKLEKTVSQMSKENYQWESKLLYANRDSILHVLK